MASTLDLALHLEDGEGVGVTMCVKSNFERRDSHTSFKSELGAGFHPHLGSYKLTNFELILATVRALLSPNVKGRVLLVHPIQCLVSCDRLGQMDEILPVHLLPSHKVF